MQALHVKIMIAALLAGGAVLVLRATSESGTGYGQSYTFHLSTPADLDSWINGKNTFERNLREQGFRELSSQSSDKSHEVLLTERYKKLKKVEVRLWSEAEWNTDEPQAGAHFMTSLDHWEDRQYVEELEELFKTAVEWKGSR